MIEWLFMQYTIRHLILLTKQNGKVCFPDKSDQGLTATRFPPGRNRADYKMYLIWVRTMFRKTMLSFTLEKKIHRTAFNFTLQASKLRRWLRKTQNPALMSLDSLFPPPVRVEESRVPGSTILTAEFAATETTPIGFLHCWGAHCTAETSPVRNSTVPFLVTALRSVGNSAFSLLIDVVNNI
jgi:hypothetical protein